LASTTTNDVIEFVALGDFFFIVQKKKKKNVTATLNQEMGQTAISFRSQTNHASQTNDARAVPRSSLATIRHSKRGRREEDPRLIFRDLSV